MNEFFKLPVTVVIDLAMECVDSAVFLNKQERQKYPTKLYLAAIPDTGKDRLFISAPGVWYWQGKAVPIEKQELL